MDFVTEQDWRVLDFWGTVLELMQAYQVPGYSTQLM